eukprot:641910-Pelagomonas_calceolata.AAC.1
MHSQEDKFRQQGQALGTTSSTASNPPGPLCFFPLQVGGGGGRLKLKCDDMSPAWGCKFMDLIDLKAHQGLHNVGYEGGEVVGRWCTKPPA